MRQVRNTKSSLAPRSPAYFFGSTNSQSILDSTERPSSSMIRIFPAAGVSIAITRPNSAGLYTANCKDRRVVVSDPRNSRVVGIPECDKRSLRLSTSPQWKYEHTSSIPSRPTWLPCQGTWVRPPFKTQRSVEGKSWIFFKAIQACPGTLTAVQLS